MIGTPPPAAGQDAARPARPADEHEAPARELPAEPDDPARAKKAEQVVAACFILAMLAGFGFIAAYVGLPVAHRWTRCCAPTWRSACPMAVAFLALAPAP